MIRSFSYHQALAAERFGYLEEKGMAFFGARKLYPQTQSLRKPSQNTNSIIANTYPQNWHMRILKALGISPTMA